MLAGDRCFATGIMPSSSTSTSVVVNALANYLRSLTATFSFAILQVHSSTVQLLQATPVPGISHYLDIEDEVHEALLEYLVR